MLPKYRELTDKFLEDLRKVNASKEEYAGALDEISDEISDECESYCDAEGLDREDLDEDLDEEDLDLDDIEEELEER